MSTNTWSETLQQQTREAIQDIFIGLDGKLHFKHIKNGNAFIHLDDLIQDRLLLIHKLTEEHILFSDVNNRTYANPIGTDGLRSSCRK